MEFYITVSSGPTSAYPFNKTSQSKYFTEKSIEFDGEYEVALVQAVFKDVHSNQLASLKILPDNENNEEFVFNIFADDGQNYDMVIDNFNSKLKQKFQNYSYKKKKTNNQEFDVTIQLNYDNVPKITLDPITMQFNLNLPENWKFEIFDENSNYLISNNSTKYYKFQSNKFNFMRHFFIISNLIDDQITGDEPTPVLTNICLTDIKSNVVVENIQNPRYIKLKKEYLTGFDLEYTSDIYSNTELKGTIISTLHFRKINGF